MTEESTGARLDVFLVSVLAGQSRSHIQRLIKDGHVLVDGHEAKDLGIASRCLPNDEVLPAALEFARDIAVNTAPLSVAFSKRLLWQSFELDRDEIARLETELHHHLMGSDDAREGVLAFLERRDPQWSRRPSIDWPGWPERDGS